MKMSFTNDVPDLQRGGGKGKWPAVCRELLRSEFRAVKIETDSHEEANRARIALIRASKRNGYNVKPTQRGNDVYLINLSWNQESAQK